MWVAFAVLLVASEQTLESIWNWVRDIPVIAEIVVWVLFFPWMLGLAVWESSWSGPVRLLFVVVFAVGWTVAFARGVSRSRPKE